VKKGRALVMEIDKGRMLVLTDGGCFRWVPSRRGAKVGDLVDLHPARPHVAAATAAVVILLTAGILFTSWILSPAVILALDINPSVELWADGAGRVVRCVGLDADGNQLVTGADLKGKPLLDALEWVIERAIALGYLQTDQENIVLATLVSRRAHRVDSQAVPERVAQILAERKIPAAVLSQQVPYQIKQRAAKGNISVNAAILEKHRTRPSEIRQLPPEERERILKQAGYRVRKVTPPGPSSGVPARGKEDTPSPGRDIRPGVPPRKSPEGKPSLPPKDRPTPGMPKEPKEPKGKPSSPPRDAGPPKHLPPGRSHRPPN